MTSTTSAIQGGNFATGSTTNFTTGAIPPEITVVRGTVLSSQTRTTFETKQMPAYAVGTRMEPGEIYMEAVDVKEFWLQRDDGKEEFFKSEHVSVNARAGHRLAVATIKDPKGVPAVMGLANLSTGEYQAEPTALAGARSSYGKLAFNTTFNAIFAACSLVLFAVILGSMRRVNAESMMVALMATGFVMFFPLVLTLNISAGLTLKAKAKALAPEMDKLKAAMLNP